MNLRQLAYLRWIISCGSFEQAAAAAGVSQSAITQAMNALQAELGLALFTRDGKRKLPTAQAIAMARAGDDLQRAVDNLMPPGVGDTGPDSDAGRASQLRVGMAPAAGLLYGPAIHKLLQAQRPDCELRLDTGNAPGMLARLLENDLDLVLAPLPRNLRHARLRQQAIYTSEPSVYCRVGHPLARARTLADIVDAQWVVAGVPGAPGNVIEEAFRVRQLAAPRVAVHCADYPMLIHLVAHSDLLGVVSHPALVPRPRSMGLQTLSLVEGLPHYQVCLFWTGDAHTGSRYRARDAVIDMLRALAREPEQGKDH